jgi:hypothetical protein
MNDNSLGYTIFKLYFFPILNTKLLWKKVCLSLMLFLSLSINHMKVFLDSSGFDIFMLNGIDSDHVDFEENKSVFKFSLAFCFLYWCIQNKLTYHGGFLMLISQCYSECTCLFLNGKRSPSIFPESLLQLFVWKNILIKSFLENHFWTGWSILLNNGGKCLLDAEN